MRRSVLQSLDDYHDDGNDGDDYHVLTIYNAPNTKIEHKDWICHLQAATVFISLLA